MRDTQILREVQALEAELSAKGLHRDDIAAQVRGYLTAALRGVCAELHAHTNTARPEGAISVITIDMDGPMVVAVGRDIDCDDEGRESAIYYATDYLSAGEWRDINELSAVIINGVNNRVQEEMEYQASDDAQASWDGIGEQRKAA